MSTRINRREFLFGSAMTAVGVALSACARQAAPQPTQPPATKAAVQASPTPIPTLAATATPVPTAAPAKEAPALAELVKQGKLPPLTDRLPKNPLVLAPVNEIGTYGGRIRSFYHWQGFWAECQYGHSAVRWINDGMEIAPGICDTWAANADNTEWTFHIREGLKWSDGEPCTVDDVLYWWEDLVLNPDHPDNPPDFGSAGGKLVEFIKVDDYTVKLKYVEPTPLTAKRLAMWVNAGIGPRWIVPKHYLKQFHPKYNSEYKDFEVHDQKMSVMENPEYPTLNPWKLSKYEASVSQTWDRNPYYYAVDTDGNQLPYIDGIDATYIEDAEVQKLTIMQGSVDFVHFHKAALSDLSTMLENQEKGGYDVVLWDSGSGTGMMYFWNYDHPDDKRRALYRNPKFKQAMSYALDRPTIQRVVYYNTGIPTTGTMSPKAIEFNFNAEAQAMYEKARSAYVDYDPAKAKALLDEIGVKDADGDGWREFPDGSKLAVSIDLPADAGTECMSVLQIAEKNWKDVGLNIVINQMPPAEFGPLWRGGKLEVHTNWEVGDGPDHLLYPSWMVPNEPDRWAPLCGNRLMLVGTPKEDTELDKSPWDRTPPRWASTEPGYKDGPVAKLTEIYLKAMVEVDELKRHHMVWDMINIHINDGPFFIGTVANYPRIIFKSKKLGNVPKKEQLRLGGFVNPWIIPYPAVTNPETYYFKA